MRIPRLGLQISEDTFITGLRQCPSFEDYIDAIHVHNEARTNQLSILPAHDIMLKMFEAKRSTFDDANPIID